MKIGCLVLLKKTWCVVLMKKTCHGIDMSSEMGVGVGCSLQQYEGDVVAKTTGQDYIGQDYIGALL